MSMWVATAVVACAGTTLGLAGTATAAPVGGTRAAAATESTERAALVGPYSTPPGPDWFFYYAYLSTNLQNAKNTCEYYAAVLWTNGYVTGASCALRYDYAGYDMWLRN